MLVRLGFGELEVKYLPKNWDLVVRGVENIISSPHLPSLAISRYSVIVMNVPRSWKRLDLTYYWRMLVAWILSVKCQRSISCSYFLLSKPEIVGLAGKFNKNSLDLTCDHHDANMREHGGKRCSSWIYEKSCGIRSNITNFGCNLLINMSCQFNSKRLFFPLNLWDFCLKFLLDIFYF